MTNNAKPVASYGLGGNPKDNPNLLLLCFWPNLILVLLIVAKNPEFIVMFHEFFSNYFSELVSVLLLGPFFVLTLPLVLLYLSLEFVIEPVWLKVHCKQDLSKLLFLRLVRVILVTAGAIAGGALTMLFLTTETMSIWPKTKYIFVVVPGMWAGLEVGSILFKLIFNNPKIDFSNNQWLKSGFEETS